MNRFLTRRMAFFTSLFVVLPLIVLVVVGVLVLVFRRSGADVAFGVLILTFCAALLAGAILLVVALKQQNDLARMQDDFLSKVSHDLRTPLTSIRMFVETLREDRLAELDRRQRVLHLLDQETARLLTLIDRLLELSRLEAGRAHYVLEAVAVAPLVQEVAARFEPRLNERTVLELKLPADVPAVQAEPIALTEVLSNLIDNAFKYTGDDKHIVIEATVEANELALAVVDNGPGIPRAAQRHVFDRFYRLDKRLSRPAAGTGLGLALARHQVQAMHGRIEVDEHHRDGARFVVHLPLAKA
jgi:two-component system phosphate regulon sensor histidine kinase PhoR